VPAPELVGVPQEFPRAGLFPIFTTKTRRHEELSILSLLFTTKTQRNEDLLIFSLLIVNFKLRVLVPSW
jgi:hypothetical protein